MQVDPLESNLKPPGTKRLKVRCDLLLSISGFKFNLRRYTEVAALNAKLAEQHESVAARGRGLHSSTFQLNLTVYDTKCTINTP